MDIGGEFGGDITKSVEKNIWKTRQQRLLVDHCDLSLVPWFLK